jgi:hypothetical protein
LIEQLHAWTTNKCPLKIKGKYTKKHSVIKIFDSDDSLIMTLIKRHS